MNPSGWYLALETLRRDGRAVAVPMWFVERDGKIYMRTPASAPKARRIARRSGVRVAPCTSRGEVTGAWIEARARLVPEMAPQVGEMILAKHGWAKRIVDLFNLFRRAEMTAIEIEITS